MSQETFFEERREWSRWKHRLLKRYLGPFVGILGSKHPTVYYVDGFAGSGRYLDPPDDGSPIIAARIASDTAEKGRNYALRCINVEPKMFPELVEATSKFTPVFVQNLQGTFREHLEELLGLVKQ